tara:strand:+ start:311 stop:1540 length:1230 start_codon:yes stop_codon:yes gene_type:complete
MASFTYKAKDRSGRRVKGEVEAPNRSDAMTNLKGRRFNSIAIKEKKYKRDASETAITWGPFGNVSDKDMLMFTKKLATMVRSGLTIIDSLVLISSQTQNVVLRGVIISITKDINLGIPLSDAVKKYPRYFDVVTSSMIEAGEMSGQLDIFLDRIVEGQERMQKIKSGIKSAMFYPITLVVVTTLIMWGMMVFVVPTFVEMYASSGSTLPGPTQMIVDASDWISQGSNVLKVIAFIIFARLTHKMGMKFIYPYNSFISRLLLSLPIFGNIIVKSTVSRLALLMSNLFAAGIGVSDILKVAIKISTNTKFTEALQRVSERVVTGVPLSLLFQEEPVFPKDLSQLIKVGESTGNMDEMLTAIARYYQEEFESTVEGLTSVIEPLMIVFVGGMIGAMVVALYLPIFSTGDMIG